MRRETKPFYEVVMLAMMICLALHTKCVSTTVVCNGCTPVSLQIAPGTGLDFGMTYATAALRFRNGTTVAVAKLDGSPDYRRAMRRIAEDALSVREGRPSTLEPVEYYEPIGNVLKTHWEELSHSVVKKLRQAFPILKPVVIYSTNPDVIAFTTMFADLRNAVENAFPDFALHPLAVLSVPDFEIEYHSQDRIAYHNRFSLAAQQARVEVTRIRAASVMAFEFHGIETCYEGIDVEYCLDDKIRDDNILVASYTDSLLEALLVKRGGKGDTWGSLLRRRLRTSLELGAAAIMRSEKPSEYWTEVQKIVEDCVGKETLDRVVILGDQAGDVDFRIALEKVLEKSLVLKKPPGYNKDHTFDAAKGAAIISRRGMPHNFSSCLESAHCERAPEHDEI